VSGKKSETTGPLGEAVVPGDVVLCAVLMAAMTMMRRVEDNMAR